MRDHDPFILFLIFSLYAFISWLIVYQIELRWRPIAKLKCRLGYHRRRFRQLGREVSQYKCSICGKPKDHPHLKVIEGGKKDFGSTFKW